MTQAHDGHTRAQRLDAWLPVIEKVSRSETQRYLFIRYVLGLPWRDAFWVAFHFGDEPFSWREAEYIAEKW